MLKAFFAQAKTVDFMHFRVKHFCPKIDPLFWDFCLWGIHENLPEIAGFPAFLTFEKLCAFLSSRALKWHKPGVSSFIH